MSDRRLEELADLERKLMFETDRVARKVIRNQYEALHDKIYGKPAPDQGSDPGRVREGDLEQVRQDH